jgi:hypothetical protein
MTKVTYAVSDGPSWINSQDMSTQGLKTGSDKYNYNTLFSSNLL